MIACPRLRLSTLSQYKSYFMLLKAKASYFTFLYLFPSSLGEKIKLGRVSFVSFLFLEIEDIVVTSANILMMSS